MRFWGDVPASPAFRVEPALAVALLPAMTTGGRLELPGPVGPQLKRALPDVQAVLQSLAVDCLMDCPDLAWVEIESPQAGDEVQTGEPGRGVGAFFSGGVDSLSTLLGNADITDLVYVHGFDIPVEQTETSAIVERRLRETADKLGRRFHVVRTNLRSLTDPILPWEIAHGPALAAVALMFAPSCERILIASSSAYEEHPARGSHPLHDHLWSTEDCRIEHDGAYLSRTAKVERIAAHQEALDVLRVCWRQVDRYNCGECEKCLRTMVALEAVGALERCSTFPERLDLDAVAKMQLEDLEVPIWWRGNLDLARKHEASPELIAAIEACLATSPLPEATASQERLSESKARADRLARELEVVRSSRSWKLTRPLRKAGRAARGLSRRRAG